MALCLLNPLYPIRSVHEIQGISKRRGLPEVCFLVSDSHGGITKAMARYFEGATWHAVTCI